mmetsp:Transcript_64361/g.155609  ORF Transcript_64361/g.155609 Transcript_64361/m.155609 type:complete len:235 (-) Transcript_64361:1871-2575(-)
MLFSFLLATGLLQQEVIVHADVRRHILGRVPISEWELPKVHRDLRVLPDRDGRAQAFDCRREVADTVNFVPQTIHDDSHRHQLQVNRATNDGSCAPRRTLAVNALASLVEMTGVVTTVVAPAVAVVAHAPTVDPRSEERAVSPADAHAVARAVHRDFVVEPPASLQVQQDAVCDSRRNPAGTRHSAALVVQQHQLEAAAHAELQVLKVGQRRSVCDGHAPAELQTARRQQRRHR